MPKMWTNSTTPRTWVQRQEIQIKDRQQSTPSPTSIYIGKLLAPPAPVIPGAIFPLFF